MEKTEKTQITVKTTVNAPIEKIWDLWNSPEHIMQWCTASEDWHTPRATNDLRVGGSFSSTMAAKDGSFAFDFEGKYEKIEENRFISYTIADGRQVEITFDTDNGSTCITETFEAETTHSVEMQQGGWQAIIDNFKKYAEAHT